MRPNEKLVMLVTFGHAFAQENCFSLPPTLFPDCAKACLTSTAANLGRTNLLDLGFKCDGTLGLSIEIGALSCLDTECGTTTLSTILSDISANTNNICLCHEAYALTSGASMITKTLITIISELKPPSTTVLPKITDSSTPMENAISLVTLIGRDKTCDSVSPCEETAQAVPSCAKSCLRSAAMDVGCVTGDYECSCSSASEIQVGAEQCVVDGCGILSAIPVLDSVSALCDCVTASPTTPCTNTPSKLARTKELESKDWQPGTCEELEPTINEPKPTTGAEPLTTTCEATTPKYDYSEPVASNDGENSGLESGSGYPGSGPNNDPGVSISCVVVTIGSGGEVVTTTTCYVLGGGATLTTQTCSPETTYESGDSSDIDNSGGGDGGGATQTSEPSAVETAAASTLEFGIVGAVVLGLLGVAIGL